MIWFPSTSAACTSMPWPTLRLHVVRGDRIRAGHFLLNNQSDELAVVVDRFLAE